jgi:hypothetical protein
LPSKLPVQGGFALAGVQGAEPPGLTQEIAHVRK